MSPHWWGCIAMGSLPSSADATQRCTAANTFLVGRKGGRRDRESGVPGFGYLIVASVAAAATVTALVLTIPPGKKRRRRLVEYWPWSRSKPGSSSDGVSCEITAALERSGLELGFCVLDTCCPPSNVILDVLHSSNEALLPSASSSPDDRFSVMCLAVNNGGYSQLSLSQRRTSPTCREFLLVEMPPDNGNDGGRAELLEMYEAVEEAARGPSPAATSTENLRGNSNDDGRRRRVLIGSLARFVCPYFGVLRVGVGTEAASSRPQGSANKHGSPRTPTCTRAGGQEKSGLLLALGDPREGMRSPCTLTIKIEAAGDAAALRPSQNQSSSLGFFHFEGMRWEGTAADVNLAGTPLAWGATLRVSLGEDWGRDLAPTEYGGIFARFFHDGVLLQAGRVISAISQLRALARLYDDCQRLRDTARETDHTGHLAPQGHQHRRRSSSNSSQRRRPSEQQRPTIQKPPKSSQPSSHMLPTRILLAYDSCSIEPASDPARRLDGSNTAKNKYGRLTKDGGIQAPGGQSRPRPSSGSTRVAERRGTRRQESEKGGEGGRCGVQVRVVEFTPDRGEESRHEQNVCRGLGQIVQYLEDLLELSHKLPALSPVGRFCSRMRFAATAEGISGGGLALSEESFPASYYRPRRSSRHSQNVFPAHREVKPGEPGDGQDEKGEEHSGPSLRNTGVQPLSDGTHGRGRRATVDDVDRGLFSGRRGSAATTPSSWPVGAGRHRSSWSPVSTTGVHFGRLVGRERARSEESGSSVRRTLLPSAATTTPAARTTDPATVSAPERFLPGTKQSRQRRSRGPSLPSVSFFVGMDSDGTPGQEGCQGLAERRRWGSMVNTAAVAVPDGTMQVRGGGRSARIEENRKGSGVEQGGLQDGIAGWPRCEREDANGKDRDPSEEELLAYIANMTGRLPQMVRETVDVGLFRGCRGEAGVEGEGQRDEDVMVGALRGWKAAVDALDQSQRELRCYRQMEGEASSAILGALEATMATFRGQVLVMTGRNAEWLACRAKRCLRNPQQAAKLFKEAHCAVKSVIVLAGGDGPSGARWRLSERQLLSIASHHLTPLLENLRLLVVAFDNMREEDRNDISTVEEIVNNRDWLLRIATICTSAERRTLSRHSRNALPSRTSTADVDDSSQLLSASAYIGSSSASTTGMPVTENARADRRRGRESQQPRGRADTFLSDRFGGGASVSSEGAGTRDSVARNGTETRSCKERITSTAGDTGGPRPTNTEQEKQEDESYLSSHASSSLPSFATAQGYDIHTTRL